LACCRQYGIPSRDDCKRRERQIHFSSHWRQPIWRKLPAAACAGTK
jgi:hypothetical protein